jgi:dTDP-L-rhamnose 4-epimerase
MPETILVTGGAGFIGSHLADRLLAAGNEVRVLDNLSPQVHGARRARPSWLDPRVDLRVGDIRDARAVRSALDGVDSVVHLAAAVGVGQSMYQIADYTEVNNYGTAVLLEALAERPVRRLVVASSMSVYGEGRYLTADGGVHDDVERDLETLKSGRWEPAAADGQELVPVATPEEKTPKLLSVYALSKYDQERLCLVVGRAYGIPTVALRFFNVYGPRQALSNPYTGVLAIFAARLLNGRSPVVFEDGMQRRDFVSVHDVARACELSLSAPKAPGQVVNIGSGRVVTIREIADLLGHAVDRTDIQPEITGRYRVGDVRHCFADVKRASEILGFESSVTLEAGLEELAGWLENQEAVDSVDQARQELERRGLTL